MNHKTRLELTWIGKENRSRLEPRILLENTERSYHAAHRVAENDDFDNILIQGDNLLALKALEQEYIGKVKCICIDPPYNTGNAFTHYEDGLEHSLWLGLMRDRLNILYQLLTDDGSIWIILDDNEAHYLKIVGDEIFGRNNFLFTFIWRNVDSPNDNKVPVASNHNFILCFAKDAKLLRLKQKHSPSILEAYPNVDENNKPYRDRLLKKNGKSSLRSDRPSMFFPVTAPDGSQVLPIHDDGREARWACGEDAIQEHRDKDTLIWKEREKGNQLVWVPYTREFAPDDPTKPYPTIWDDLDTTRQTKAHLKQVLAGVPEFATPKPEDLMSRILTMATNPGDIVLDSFAGSGTTGAVAHKMGRRWIMVELGEHAHTHIVPRLQKVIDGTDKGGVTEATGWKGGGGFRYYTLAPSLLEKDRWGNWIINKEYNAAMLSEALCKIEGFRYEPSDSVYWQQGRSTESDYLYVTTQTLNHEQLQALSEDVGNDRSLLVLCGAFQGNTDMFSNLTVRKIPKSVLHRCEWGHDDYSLKVGNLPKAPVVPSPTPKTTTPSLFATEEDTE